MKLNTGKDTLDLGFPVPEAGVSNMQIMDVDYSENEETGALNLKLKMVILENVEGPADNVNMQPMYNINLVDGEGKPNAFGEKTICSLLTVCDLADAFEKKFPDDTAFTDEKFISALQMKLPKNVVQFKHDQGEFNNKPSMEWLQLSRVAKNKAAGKKAAAKKENTKPAEDAVADDDDW